MEVLHLSAHVEDLSQDAQVLRPPAKRGHVLTEAFERHRPIGVMLGAILDDDTTKVVAATVPRT